MCYGSGCLKENHMGDCRVYNYAPYRETSYGSPCVLYGAFNSVITFYLTSEEYEEICDLNKMEELKNLAFDRWNEDEKRKQTIKEIEEKYPWYER